VIDTDLRGGTFPGLVDFTKHWWSAPTPRAPAPLIFIG
jgi:hypothetical protein